MPKAPKAPKAPAAPQVSADAVTVSWKGKTREYSREVHGDDFEALAGEFAEKVGGTVE